MVISTALAIGSALASIIGTALNAKGNADERRQLERNRRKLDAWYEKEYNTNYMDTDEGKATMTLLRNQLREANKRNDDTNAMRGSTDEARLANATSANNTIASTALRLAANDTARKRQIDQMYRTQDYNLANLEAAALKERTQNYANLVHNAGNLMSSAASLGSINAPKGTQGAYSKGYLIETPKTVTPQTLAQDATKSIKISNVPK